MCLAFAIVLAGLLGSAHGGAATEIVVVGMHVEGLKEREAKKAADDLATALGRVEGMGVVGPDEAAARIRGRSARIVDDALLAQGRALLAEGRVLFEHADLDSAMDRMTEAIIAFEEALVGITDTKDLIDALVVQGTAGLAMGDMEQTKIAFTRVVQLDPDRELDVVHHSPKVVAFFDQVRTEVLESPRGIVSVQVDVEDALVYLDGQERGVGSITIRQVVAGRHHLLVTTAAGWRSHTLVDVSPSERTTVDAVLTERFIGVPARDAKGRSLQIEHLYRAVGDQVSQGLLLLAGEIGDGRVGMQVYEPRTGKYSKVLEAPAAGAPIQTLLQMVPRTSAFRGHMGNLPAGQVGSYTMALNLSTNPVLTSMLLDTTAPAQRVVVAQSGRQIHWGVWVGTGVVLVGVAAVVMVLLPDDTPAGAGGKKKTGTVVLTF